MWLGMLSVFVLFCLPAKAEIDAGFSSPQQQMEFLNFLEFLGNISELESVGVDIDQLLSPTPLPDQPPTHWPEPALDYNRPMSKEQ